MIKQVSELVAGRIYKAVTGNDGEFAYLFMYDGGNIESDDTLYTSGTRTTTLEKLGPSGSLNVDTNKSFKYYLEATLKQQEFYYQITNTQPQQLINFLP